MCIRDRYIIVNRLRLCFADSGKLLQLLDSGAVDIDVDAFQFRIWIDHSGFGKGNAWRHLPWGVLNIVPDEPSRKDQRNQPYRCLLYTSRCV